MCAPRFTRSRIDRSAAGAGSRQGLRARGLDSSAALFGPGAVAGVGAGEGGFATGSAGGVGIRVGRRVSASPAAETATNSSPDAPPAAPADRPTVAIVFDALKPDALELAQTGAAMKVLVAPNGA